jgi:16S rRNA (uracil1498-N3)-methyltransferase
MRRFLVPPFHVDAKRIVLDAQNSHHLLNVLRLVRGGSVLLFTGASWEVEATLIDVQDSLAVLELVGPRRPLEAAPHVHLLLGIPKGPAMDLAVRMATEAGVREIHPMRCQRTVPKGDRSSRWKKIAESASQQSGRADVPLVHPPQSFSETLELHNDFDHRFIAAPNTPTGTQGTGSIAVAIGPEGGFTLQEMTLAQDMGYQRLGLGPFILRTDTAAAIAVATVLKATSDTSL